jgi:hypothetical protein
VYLMPPSAILRGAQQLHNVGERLDTLADQRPLASEALITISGNVRHTATLPEVLALTRMGPVRAGSAKCLIYSSSVDTAL